MTFPTTRTFQLEEARLKLNRGKEHLYELETEARKFWDTQSYTLIHEYDFEQSENLLRFQWGEPFPQLQWGLILGDAVHNTRSALDYIVWRLAGSDFNDRSSMFPFYISENDWGATFWRFKKRPIHPEALAYIESLQPYKRPDPERSIFWCLQELDARDKHKLITVTQTLARTAKISGVGQMEIPYEAIDKPLENGTVIVKYPGPAQPPMHLEVFLAFHVVLDKSVGSVLAGREIGSVLSPIFDGVDVIIGNFENRPDWFPS